MACCSTKLDVSDAGRSSPGTMKKLAAITALRYSSSSASSSARTLARAGPAALYCAIQLLALVSVIAVLYHSRVVPNRFSIVTAKSVSPIK